MRGASLVSVLARAFRNGLRYQPIDESQYSDIVTINILEGSVVQGNPDYDPDAPTAGSDALITWVNNDNTLHTATSGSGPSGAMV